VAPAGLKFVILLPQTPKCWDYRPAHPANLVFYNITYLFIFAVLGFELRALYLHRHSTV
jgi:hypothetical protein